MAPSLVVMLRRALLCSLFIVTIINRLYCHTHNVANLAAALRDDQRRAPDSLAQAVGTAGPLRSEKKSHSHCWHGSNTQLQY